MPLYVKALQILDFKYVTYCIPIIHIYTYAHTIYNQLYQLTILNTLKSEGQKHSGKEC